MDFSSKIVDYTERLTDQIKKTDVETVNRIMNLLLEARDNGKQIFIMGNGGSAASASHIVNDYNKGLSLGKERAKRWRWFCLSDNTPTVLSLANDVEYADIFVEQLKNFLNEDDIVIGLSGSGNSENVLRAIRYANDCGNTTVGMTAFGGGKLKEEAAINIHFDIFDMQIAEDLHMMLLHSMMNIFASTDC